ncbi:MAG: sigma 54-interacting transcriptional regulator [Steroidobacteraceae bacterium]
MKPREPKASSGAMPNRISLAEASRQSGRMLNRGRSEELAEQATPTLEELAECIYFSPGDGRAWLNDQRIVLMQTATLSRLRQELIDLVGLERARGVFSRVGYAQGARDAQLIRKRWPDKDLTHYLGAGPRIHTIEGYVKAETVRFEYDVDSGHYYGEFLWRDSSEADEHLMLHAVANQPMCWLQIAYPTGYTSWLFGKLILFREVECRAMGAPYCRCIGQPVDAWGDAADKFDLQALKPPPRAAVPQVKELTNDDNDLASDHVVGVSGSFITARHMLERVSRTDATVLLAGESGVGKELFAHTLHEMSPRRARPFIAVNCAAIPDSLMEAELFGVEKGAFTGATHSRAGRFERAQGGTLFLDEIASLSPVSQGKLLRVLQEREIERIGSTRTTKVDVRVVVATNVDLRKEVAAGRFREDLFFRLNVFPIDLPPLRERRDDIPLLMDHFLRLYSRQHRVARSGFTRRAIEALLSYDYPGNVREMQNLIERGVVFAEPGDLIDVTHMFRHGEKLEARSMEISPSGTLRRSLGATPTPTANTQPTLPEVERRLLADALERHRGNVSAAARAVGLSRAALEYRLRKFGLLKPKRQPSM